jgi:hypothetical protein
MRGYSAGKITKTDPEDHVFRVMTGVSAEHVAFNIIEDLELGCTVVRVKVGFCLDTDPCHQVGCGGG